MCKSFINAYALQPSTSPGKITGTFHFTVPLNQLVEVILFAFSEISLPRYAILK